MSGVTPRHPPSWAAAPPARPRRGMGRRSVSARAQRHAEGSGDKGATTWCATGGDLGKDEQMTNLCPGVLTDSRLSSQGVDRKLLADGCFLSEEQLVDAVRLSDEDMYPAFPVKVDEWRATRRDSAASGRFGSPSPRAPNKFAESFRVAGATSFDRVRISCGNCGALAWPIVCFWDGIKTSPLVIITVM